MTIPLVASCTSFGPTELDRVDPNQRVILSSGRPFALHAESAGVKAVCMSHEVTGRVVRRAGDTLYLSVTARRALSVDEPTLCTPPVSGFVAVTPSVDTKGRQFAILPTLFLAAVIAPFLIIAVFLMAGYTYSL